VFIQMGEGTYTGTLSRRTELRRADVADAAAMPAGLLHDTQPAKSRTTRIPGGVLRFVPWLIPATTAVVALRLLDVPAWSIAKYAAYFVFGIVLPGILLLRALCGSTGSWPEDAGLGAAVGFAYELAGWAIFTATGQQEYLAAWPALVLVVFVTARPLHRHWRIGRPPRVPVAWHWGVALAAAVAIVLGTYFGLAASTVPPDGVAYYPDLLYHLSMVQEAMRSVPPELPQAAGHRLDYHWFANAHMAAASDITGLRPELVLLRLWILPVHVVALLVFAALARQVSRTWWAGVIAAWLLCTGQYVDAWAIPASLGTSPMSYFSPSLEYGTVLAVAAAVLLIDQLYRGRAPLRIWALTIPLLAAAGGAKPTGLPLLLGGIGLAGVCQLVRSRRFPWRGLVAGLVVVAVMLLTLRTVVGSTAGSRTRLFGLLRLLPGYVEATGDEAMAAGPGWTLPALTDGDTVAYWGALAILGTLLVSQLSSLAAFGLIGHRGTRRDPVAWFLVGAFLAGWLGLLVVDHPSGGELYFLRSALPFATAGVAWLMTSALRGRSWRMHAAVLIGGVALGTAFVLIAGRFQPNPLGSRENRIDALVTPMAVLVGSCLVLVPLWFLARWPLRRLKGVGAGVAVAVLTGMLLPSWWGSARGIADQGWPQARSSTSVPDQVHPDEQRAALWLRAHSAPDDIVASNTACRPARRQPPCDARGYIVSGIAGRRAVLEGWAYTQQALAEHGLDEKTYHRQSPPWPDRAGILDRLFSSPTREIVETLRTTYGVRWVYADQLAGRVPVKTLGKLAVLRHEEPSVLIYELVDQDGHPARSG
jgi:hypothetical protein